MRPQAKGVFWQHRILPIRPSHGPELDNRDMLFPGGKQVKLGTMFRRLVKRGEYPRLLAAVTRGPLLGYYHYLTGYFVPVYDYMVRHPDHDVVVLGCGPMDKWLALLPREPVRIIDATEGLQTAYRAKSSGFARRHVVRTFVDWDRYPDFHKRPIASVARHIRQRFGQQESTTAGHKPHVVVLTREHVPPELDAHPSREFGPAKRSIPNLYEIQDALSTIADVTFLDGSKASPEETVNTCRKADVLVGQHGAGLTNALFVRSGVPVVEIGWHPPEDNPLGHFRELSKSLGLPWHYLNLQSDKFSPISIPSLCDELKLLLQHRVTGT